MKTSRKPRPAEPTSKRPGATIVRLVPVRTAARNGRARDPNRCEKCDSTYIVREPAFVHCRYCGAMHRIHDGSLLAQEEFEMRSGLRLAS